mmetsp:Transcript_3428/g.10408  ORF Transcript_3428/g.10408 Transcript_3428/m.10408 type:complete len:327 (+) Transcript_3428:1017-1997(+)
MHKEVPIVCKEQSVSHATHGANLSLPQHNSRRTDFRKPSLCGFVWKHSSGHYNGQTVKVGCNVGCCDLCASVGQAERPCNFSVRNLHEQSTFFLLRIVAEDVVSTIIRVGVEKHALIWENSTQVSSPPLRNDPTRVNHPVVLEHQQPRFAIPDPSMARPAYEQGPPLGDLDGRSKLVGICGPSFIPKGHLSLWVELYEREILVFNGVSSFCGPSRVTHCCYHSLTVTADRVENILLAAAVHVLPLHLEIASRYFGREVVKVLSFRFHCRSHDDDISASFTGCHCPYLDIVRDFKPHSLLPRAKASPDRHQAGGKQHHQKLHRGTSQ